MPTGATVTITTETQIVPAAAVPMTTPEPSVVRPMPRRKFAHSVHEVNVALPRARRVRFHAGVMLTVSRLLVWIWGFVRFYSGNLLDVLRGRASVQRRAVRLRRVLEDGGPTFAKLAQQVSMRADMLPYAYCAELGKMLYQARLRTGTRVAVKVRRPGIGPLIAADLRALDWLLIVGETLTVIPPGIARNFRDEFQTILFNEMNFRAEARYTDLFRRRAAKHKKDVTAPRVYFQYCSDEVLVSEFVSGVWMWELMAAVDRNDQEFLAQVARIGIEPRALARKIVVIMQREIQEELFFHADPHPANLVIMPDNKICFIDFGAIGRFSTQVRKILREFQHHALKGDIGRMVNCSLSLLGPLPPLDVERIRHELEKIYADWIYAVYSKDAEWWEKSSAQAWLRFLEVAREFRIPASGEMIQFFRTSFSYDAIITRLDKNLDVASALQAYARQAAREARQRVQSGLRKRRWGLTDMDYLQLEEFGDMVTQGIFQLQRNIENPIIHFKNIVGKIAYIASLFLKLGYLVAALFGFGLIAGAIARRWFGYELHLDTLLQQAMASGWLLLGGVALVLVVIRRIVIRLSLPDTRLNPE